MHSRNAFKAAKEAALAKIAAARQFDVELAAAVSAAASYEQLSALPEMTNRRHEQHARVAEACRYLTKLGTRPTTNPLRNAIQRSDSTYIARIFMRMPPQGESYVRIDVESLDEARVVFDKVLAAAWPGLLDECQLPRDTSIPAGVFDAYVALPAVVYNGKVCFSLGLPLCRVLPPGFVCDENHLKLCRANN